MMRQIVLDTETTGLDPKLGHRIIEIGCVELVDRRLTGNHYHQYINPQREIDSGALAVHGITNEYLRDKPIFSDVCEEFLGFVTGAELIIHNAAFDVGFINHEFSLFNRKIGGIERYCKVFDTLSLARQLHPGQKNNLDALCKRYRIENFKRDLHGALLDSEILAQVYLTMTSGQECLFGESGAARSQHNGMNNKPLSYKAIEGVNSIVIHANDAELRAHQEFLEMLKKKSPEESVADLW